MRRGLFLVCLLTLPLALSAQSASGAPTQTSADAYTRTAAATKQMKAPFGDFAIWYDPAKWQVKKSDSAGELRFESANGEGYAKVFTEEKGVPTELLTKVALTNARQADPNAKLTAQEYRKVNGREVLMLQMEATIHEDPVHFYGYYYGGFSGTIQVVTMTRQSDFAKNVADLTDFLNGLVISDEPLMDPPSDASSKGPVVVPLNDGKASIQYDGKKWRQASDDNGNFGFALLRRDGYAIIISEPTAVSLDTLPDLALKNAKAADPDARMISREKRSVNGVDVWFVKLEATAKGVPFSYCDYLYSGKAGTIQLFTFTEQDLIGVNEPDFLEFLNSFRVRQE